MKKNRPVISKSFGIHRTIDTNQNYSVRTESIQDQNANKTQRSVILTRSSSKQKSLNIKQQRKNIGSLNANAENKSIRNYKRKNQNNVYDEIEPLIDQTKHLLNPKHIEERKNSQQDQQLVEEAAENLNSKTIKAQNKYERRKKRAKHRLAMEKEKYKIQYFKDAKILNDKYQNLDSNQLEMLNESLKQRYDDAIEFLELEYANKFTPSPKRSPLNKTHKTNLQSSISSKDHRRSLGEGISNFMNRDLQNKLTTKEYLDNQKEIARIEFQKDIAEIEKKWIDLEVSTDEKDEIESNVQELYRHRINKLDQEYKKYNIEKYLENHKQLSAKPIRMSPVHLEKPNVYPKQVSNDQQLDDDLHQLIKTYYNSLNSQMLFVQNVIDKNFRVKLEMAVNKSSNQKNLNETVDVLQKYYETSLAQCKSIPQKFLDDATRLKNEVANKLELFELFEILKLSYEDDIKKCGRINFEKTKNLMISQAGKSFEDIKQILSLKQTPVPAEKKDVSQTKPQFQTQTQPQSSTIRSKKQSPKKQAQRKMSLLQKPKINLSKRIPPSISSTSVSNFNETHQKVKSTSKYKTQKQKTVERAPLFTDKSSTASIQTKIQSFQKSKVPTISAIYTNKARQQKITLSKPKASTTNVQGKTQLLEKSKAPLSSTMPTVPRQQKPKTAKKYPITKPLFEHNLDLLQRQAKAEFNIKLTNSQRQIPLAQRNKYINILKKDLEIKLDKINQLPELQKQIDLKYIQAVEEAKNQYSNQENELKKRLQSLKDEHVKLTSNLVEECGLPSGPIELEKARPQKLKTEHNLDMFRKRIKDTYMDNIVNLRRQMPVAEREKFTINLKKLLKSKMEKIDQIPKLQKKIDEQYEKSVQLANNQFSNKPDELKRQLILIKEKHDQATHNLISEFEAQDPVELKKTRELNYKPKIDLKQYYERAEKEFKTKLQYAQQNVAIGKRNAYIVNLKKDYRKKIKKIENIPKIMKKIENKYNETKIMLENQFSDDPERLEEQLKLLKEEYIVNIENLDENASILLDESEGTLSNAKNRLVKKTGHIKVDELKKPSPSVINQKEKCLVELEQASKKLKSNKAVLRISNKSLKYKPAVSSTIVENKNETRKELMAAARKRAKSLIIKKSKKDQIKYQQEQEEQLPTPASIYQNEGANDIFKMMLIEKKAIDMKNPPGKVAEVLTKDDSTKLDIIRNSLEMTENEVVPLKIPTAELNALNPLTAEEISVTLKLNQPKIPKNNLASQTLANIEIPKIPLNPLPDYNRNTNEESRSENVPVYLNSYKYENLFQARGSVFPKWFPGYFTCGPFKNSTEVIIRESPSDVLIEAWNIMKPVPFYG